MNPAASDVAGPRSVGRPTSDHTVFNTEKVRHMPLRPRQHVIEDASRRAFEGLLPEEWVYRPLPRDYGIDGEVEIFREGKSTGLIFEVQLKGTDREDNLSIRLSHEKVEYYRLLSDPVLIVLLNAPSERVFARWLQSYDPHIEPPSKKSIALRFSDEHELTPASVSGLLADLQTHRRLSNAGGALPLKLSVVREDAQVAGSPTSAIALTVRDAAAVISDIFAVHDAEIEGATGTITLRRDAVIISCRGLMSATVHYPDPWLGQPDPDLVLHDILVMLGVLLNRIGQAEAAARLFAKYSIGSSVIRNDEAATTVAMTLIRTHRMSDAIRILESLSDEEVANTMLVAMSLIWTGKADSLSNAERDEVIEHLIRRAAQEEAQGDDRGAAVVHFNLANRLRALGRHDQALEHFRRAAHLDPAYPERDYYSGEFGGSLFESGDFDTAVEMYQRAVNKGGRKRYLPLFADALLMSGRFGESSEAFGQVATEETTSRNTAEWRLKLRALRRVLEFGGKRQARDPELAFRLADVSDANLSDDQRRQQLEDALHADALSPLAWFNLGLLESREGDLEGAFVAFVAAGVIARVDLEAFARALLIGVAIEDGLVSDVIRAACFFNRTGFIHFLVHDLQTPSEDAHSALLDFVEAVLADEATGAAEIDRAMQFRFVGDDGSYESIEVRLE